MNAVPPTSLSLTAINRKRGISCPVVTRQREAPALIEPLELPTSAIPAAASAEPAAPSIKLPFDPLRVIDALIRRWWLMLLAGLIFSAAMLTVGWLRFETLYTVKSQIIKQQLASAFRQSDSGESFKPTDLTIPTLMSLMYSGATIAATAIQLEHRYEESALRSGLIVAAERNTDIVNISMTSNVSADAVLEMLKAYTETVLQLSRELQRSDASNMKAFLQKQIERTDADLLKVNEELLAYGRQSHLLDADKQMDAWLAELGNFTLKYETLKLDHDTLDVRILGIERELGKVDTNAARVDTAKKELADLRVRYTDEHPAVVESMEKLNSLEQQMKSSGMRTDAPPKPGESNVAESLYLDLVRLRSEKQVMGDQLTKLLAVREGINQRLALLPRQAMEYAHIKSRKQTLETSRALLAGRQREAALYEENSQGYFRLFSMSRAQDVIAVKPTQKLIMAGAGGFGGGALLVAAIVVILTLLDGYIRSSGDLKRATGLPVLGALPLRLDSATENEESWAFRTWTRLQPMLQTPTSGGAMICGVLHAAEDNAASRLIGLLADAAIRRGLACITITRELTEDALTLTAAVDQPERPGKITREITDRPYRIGMDEEWQWTPSQRQQWQAALAHWRTLPGVVILIELPAVEQPEALLIAEQLPNLLWAGSSGTCLVQKVQDALRMYRDAGCRLIAAVLDRAPALRPAALARFGALALLLGSFSSASAQTALPLGPGDAVNINMPGFEGLERKEVPVGPDGKLTYMQARDIQASGLSLDQLREKLVTELRRYYRNARVVVTPSTFQSRKVYVLGKVVKKGAINLDRPLTILEVVAEAGGLETGLFQQNTVELADLGRSFVMRGQTRLPVNLEALFLHGDMKQNARVEPGDYLYFPSANSNEIYVLGDVKMQGTQGLLAHTSVHSAIAQAGGFTPKAYTRRVLVVRGSFEKPERFVVDMEDVLTARAKGFHLEPKDILFVADKPWARAEELLHMAINAFLQGAVSGWTRANIGPYIQQPILPQLR
ncbi:MAG: SLBB domain-containing protein [Prosthecobacter sp.]|uniref:SLBB domain-containing protein n=1 Tax=Prosthecobacter sp. TaxID=1965333 RepID=UPI003BB1712A